MAAVRESEGVEARYWYIWAIFMDPDICRNLASHLLIDHSSEPVGHRNPQKDV